MFKLVFTFTLLSPLLFVGLARADIYVYRDDRGVLHFSNVPSESSYQIVKERGRSHPAFILPYHRLEETIRTTSGRYGVDPHLVRAIIKVESDFNSAARSYKGAQGLMQLMPETARLHYIKDVYDPHENIEGGVRHLKFLLDRYQGNLRLTLAAYNAGVKAVEQYRGIPPFPETKEYIRRVLEYHRRYRQDKTASARERAKR